MISNPPGRLTGADSPGRLVGVQLYPPFGVSVQSK